MHCLIKQFSTQSDFLTQRTDHSKRIMIFKGVYLRLWPCITERNYATLIPLTNLEKQIPWNTASEVGPLIKKLIDY